MQSNRACFPEAKLRKVFFFFGNLNGYHAIMIYEIKASFISIWFFNNLNYIENNSKNVTKEIWYPRKQCFPTVSERGDGTAQKLPDKNWFLTFGKMLYHWTCEFTLFLVLHWTLLTLAWASSKLWCRSKKPSTWTHGTARLDTAWVDCASCLREKRLQNICQIWIG